MIRWFVVLVALAAALVAAVENAQEEYQKEYIADKEYLHKQKLVYDVLYHFTQPKLNTELYEIGQNYNLVENINSFTDKVKFLFCKISPISAFLCLKSESRLV